MYILSDCETDEKYGIRPEKRAIHTHINYGVINLDKCKGPTSHQVVTWVKDILKVSTTGHGGTLDPKVTGVLPIAINKSTKMLQALLVGEKEYVGVMHLHSGVSEQKLISTKKKFEGKITQLPPVRSAVKRAKRIKFVYEFKILEISGRDVLFSVKTSPGTYIRKLIHDFGIALGTGAHMLELRRTKSCSFEEKDSVKLQDVQDAYIFWQEEGEGKYLREVILPVEKLVEHLQKIYLKDSAVSAFCYGANLSISGIVKLDKDIKRDTLVALFTLKDELIGLGTTILASNEIINKDHGYAVKPARILMERDTYPRAWK